MSTHSLQPSLACPFVSSDIAPPKEWICRSRQFGVRLAETIADVEAAQRLRFEVFNLELRKGLADSFVSGRDEDRFDTVCDHLLLEDISGRIIGTYRLQSGRNASLRLGYYSEQEFDFTPYETLRPQMLELGRACIAREHRSFQTLCLLWRAIAIYAEQRGLRYLIGCSSLNSQSEAEGSETYRKLQPFLNDPELRTVPVYPYYFCCGPEDRPVQVKIPKLLQGYLSMGAKICGPPAIDREFKTIDFLTFMDLQTLPAVARVRFLEAA